RTRLATVGGRRGDGDRHGRRDRRIPDRSAHERVGVRDPHRVGGVARDGRGRHRRGRGTLRPFREPATPARPRAGGPTGRAGAAGSEALTGRYARPVTDRGGLAAVLFDMDGTLVDSEKVWQAGLDDLAAHLGGELPTPVRKSLVGTTTPEAIGI